MAMSNLQSIRIPSHAVLSRLSTHCPYAQAPMHRFVDQAFCETLASVTSGATPEAGESLGTYLRQTRRALGLSLRGVEAATEKAVTNGYLSQIEGGTVTRPSPNVLYHLAQVYKIDYGDLLVRAGHRVPRADGRRDRGGVVAGIPLRALEELTADEREELVSYIAFLRQKRAGKEKR